MSQMIEGYHKILVETKQQIQRHHDEIGKLTAVQQSAFETLLRQVEGVARTLFVPFSERFPYARQRFFGEGYDMEVEVGDEEFHVIESHPDDWYNEDDDYPWRWELPFTLLDDEAERITYNQTQYALYRKAREDQDRERDERDRAEFERLKEKFGEN